MNSTENKIIVVGAGVSGIRAALDLAETGNHVLLIDKAPGHGGILPQLDHQFPDNHCGMCRMLPMVDRDMGKQFCLKKGLIHENIEILRSCEITDVKGSPGNLQVSLTQSAPGIDKEKCINCGKCEEVCPEFATDQFNDQLSQRKAVYFPVPFQVPNNRMIDKNACTRCDKCKKACDVDAIDLSFEDKPLKFDQIHSVIIATGTPLYNPEVTDLYGYGTLENVITSTGFERLVSQSGPTKGEPLRPSDGERIKKIAWIQCVGSRNIMTDSDYCSSVCCMFSLKEAVLAKNKIGSQCDTAIFYMDMRTYGRDAQRYRDKAEKEHGVRLIRTRIHSVEQDPETFDPKLSYIDDNGEQVEERFDLIVLATGKCAEKDLPPYTRMKGIHLVNTQNEFKDISETVIEASAAVVKTGAFKALPPRRNLPLPLDPPSFLVGVCGCGSSQKRPEGTARLIERINRLPGRMKAIPIESACSRKGFDTLISEAALPEFNRLIILSCSADLFRSRTRMLEEKTGIHRNHMEFLESIWLDDDELLSRVTAAYGAVKTRNTWKERQKEVFRHCIIAGAGPAGLAAADTLARYEIPVTLVEKETSAGGNLESMTGEEEIAAVKKLKAQAKENPHITLMTESEITGCQGTPGRFSLSVNHPGGFEVIPAGAVILATGGKKKATQSYGGHSNSNITTLFELEHTLDTKSFANKQIVMLQCVDSREEPDNYCSRICCIKALKTAMRIKEKNPGAGITILYRDIMTYGDHEKLYTRARKKGIRFILYSLEQKPEIREDGDHTVVSIHDPVLQEQASIKADIVSLSTGIRPHDNPELAKVFDLKKTRDGFIREADYKWRPVDTGKEGVFACGLARRPLNALEAIKEGNATAMRAIRILNKEILVNQMVTAMVRHSICSRCELCISACPYQARYIEPESNLIRVDDASCQACGTCASVCPNNATVVSGYEDGGVMNRIESLL